MAAVEKLITDNLDIWYSAIKSKSSVGRGSNGKKDLYGIRRLRELILELAIHGLLVPQDDNDQPINELIEKMKKEKASLIELGGIKKPKKLQEISEGEIPVMLPKGWGYMRFGDAVNVLNGRAYKKHEMLAEGTPLLRVGNLFTSNEWYYSDLELEPEKYIDNGDLIYAWSASFGPFIWDGGKVIYHYHIWKLDFYDAGSIYKEYVYNYLLAITEEIKASGSGIAMIHMTKERMEKLVFPVPPLEEQKRIVAKVDELMALCDALEAQQENSIAAHLTLVETLLAALTNAQNPEAFNQAWSRIAEHFDILFTTEHSIDQLKQTILQLAVMGKLVPQDPNDEPASNSFKEFFEYKKSLADRKKIKLKKRSKDIDFDVSGFPKVWEIFKWNDISHWITYGFTRPMPHYDSGIPIVTGKNVNHSKIIFDTASFTDSNSYRKLSEKDRPKPGDILITKDGSIGRTAIVEEEKEFCINQSVAVIWLKHMTAERRFLKLVIDSPLCQKHIESHSKGQAIKHLSITDFGNMPCPIPPLNEQKRIVAKVEELLVVCEYLKSALITAKGTQLHLADAMAEQALRK